MKCSTIFLAVGLTASSVNAYSVSLWANDNYQGTKVTYSTAGRHYMSFNADSYKWTSGFADGCCIRFCNNGASVGYQCGSKSNPTSPKIDQVVLGCGSASLTCGPHTV